MANNTALSKAEQNALAVSYDVLGTHVELDLQFVKQYLVRGSAELVSDQEIVFFMNTCKGDFFDALSDDEKSAGYIKFNIPNPETPRNLNGEGVWGWVPPEDKQKYDDDSFAGKLTAILCNDPIYYSGTLFAGQEVVIRCNGESRPILDPDWAQEHLAVVDNDAEEIAAPDREWRLGEDLSTYDSLLDGVTFDDLILQMHCNVPKEKITPECVRAQLHELLDSRLEDMWFLVEKNMDKITEYSRDYYRD